MDDPAVVVVPGRVVVVDPIVVEVVVGAELVDVEETVVVVVELVVVAVGDVVVVDGGEEDVEVEDAIEPMIGTVDVDDTTGGSKGRRRASGQDPKSVVGTGSRAVPVTSVVDEAGAAVDPSERVKPRTWSVADGERVCHQSTPRNTRERRARPNPTTKMPESRRPTETRSRSWSPVSVVPERASLRATSEARSLGLSPFLPL